MRSKVLIFLQGKTWLLANTRLTLFQRVGSKLRRISQANLMGSLPSERREIDRYAQTSWTGRTVQRFLHLILRHAFVGFLKVDWRARMFIPFSLVLLRFAFYFLSTVALCFLNFEYCCSVPGCGVWYGCVFCCRVGSFCYFRKVA